MPEIRTAVRTGDTLMHERRAMLQRPPHILVTTPESLYILLTAEKSREILRDVETVIVDEIHAVADDKRGAHLALSLERLDALSPDAGAGAHRTFGHAEADRTGRAVPDRQRPARSRSIVDIGHRRAHGPRRRSPGQRAGPGRLATRCGTRSTTASRSWSRQHRSTLVFVNTRRLAERVAHHLAERLGEDAVAAHHGSLARKLRLEAEQQLKAGEVQVLVATASLELGIDIGIVDLVCQIGSPRSIAVALQRIGRAGHWRGAMPKGRIFATTRDELLECAALVRAIRQRRTRPHR